MEGVFVWWVGWDIKKLEFVSDEAIYEICADDFSWSLRAVFTYVVL
jgi:hypothetical protein